MADSRLLWAVWGGAIRSLQELLTAGECNINVQDWIGQTLLHWAARIGHIQFVQLLLQNGADTSIQDKDGCTPLHGAAWYDHTQCVQLLLQHGADTNIQSKNGWTPLHVAAEMGGHHFTALPSAATHNVSSFSSNTGRMPVYSIR
ncbi:ankyrin repeat domain-containing protein 65-like [Lingula anatina]|uniref:Ankyrin repeat domain-containing protein 65-like n=1 Tax=Lingula anatina TaxID=7574 RepID=A0A1S3HSE2_LINAN|nr:ankyrin repeat domain-containing protein 65-like [Lingula anatina]|eukprot:XP_013388955.1 ankyrin repeat domain-containing protein 65-like [Lingula anatina]